MSDLSNFRQQVTEYGKRATEAEKSEQYEQAYGLYVQALTVFMHLIKFEKNPKLKELYSNKMDEYMKRAEYIKKTVLDK